MIWDDYYEKIDDWAVSTAVNKIASLEDMGAPDEIVDALNIIAFEDEEAAEQQDLEYEIQDAIDAADYALDCLAQAQSSINDSSTARFLDMMNKGFFTSLMKYSALSESDVEMRQAQNAIDNLNAELRVLQKNKSVQLKYGRLATAIDLWIDDGLLDALTYLQINKAQKRIARAITQVENIRRELRKCL